MEHIEHMPPDHEFFKAPPGVTTGGRMTMGTSNPCTARHSKPPALVVLVSPLYALL